jgi:menaquinone-dependent protoporphyrinogen oxidase
MAPLRILVLFASSHGQTRAITEALAARLREQGAEVEVVDAETRRPPPPTAYDIVGFSSRVHDGEHAPSIIGYIDRHRSELLARQTFFVSVSLTASDQPHLPDPGGYIRGTVYATSWRPDQFAAIAGGLPYRRYGAIRRLLMKVWSSRHGQPVDTSRDYVFTDWGEVRAFADAIVARAREPTQPERVHGIPHKLAT